jgi:hypothetical protein
MPLKQAEEVVRDLDAFIPTVRETLRTLNAAPAHLDSTAALGAHLTKTLAPAGVTVPRQTLTANLTVALGQLEAVHKLLRDDSAAQALWLTDTKAVLRSVGIDPEARQEVGMAAFDDAGGAQCFWCTTPSGSLCKC